MQKQKGKSKFELRVHVLYCFRCEWLRLPRAEPRQHGAPGRGGGGRGPGAVQLQPRLHRHRRPGHQALQGRRILERPAAGVRT